WESVGTLANEQRGLVLLTMAHAVAGLGSRAVTLAERCLGVGKAHDELLTPFDRAAAAASMATALRSSGEPAQAREWEHRAQALLATLDEDDRLVVERLLNARVPNPQKTE